MLGGYYLGQLYLGISGLPAGSITVQNTDHWHSADNITLVQHYTVVVSNATHSATSDSLDIIENKLLAIASADNSLTSDNISLVQHHTLEIDSGVHALFDYISRIINLADYSYYSGVYIRDFGYNGDIDQAMPEYGVVAVNRTTNADTLVPVTQDTGTFITEFSTFGRYK